MQSTEPPTVRTADGLTLRGRAWPVPGAPGQVVIVHGLGEHVARYAHVAGHLNGAGWSVIGYDQRGHGRSEGPRGRLASGHDLLADLACVIDAVRAEAQSRLVLLGHSLGGLVAARFVAEVLEPRPRAWQRDVDALVLSSPALDVGMRRTQKVLLAVLGRLAPDLAVANGLDPAWLSHDPAVVAAYTADPLVHDRISPRLARFLADNGAVVQARAAQWRVPTLLLFAGRDRCVAPRGSRSFAAAAPRDIVEVREFEPLFHEIFNEPEQVEVFEALEAWLASRLP